MLLRRYVESVEVEVGHVVTVKAVWELIRRIALEIGHGITLVIGVLSRHVVVQGHHEARAIQRIRRGPRVQYERWPWRAPGNVRIVRVRRIDSGRMIDWEAVRAQVLDLPLPATFVRPDRYTAFPDPYEEFGSEDSGRFVGGEFLRLLQVSPIGLPGRYTLRPAPAARSAVAGSRTEPSAAAVDCREPAASPGARPAPGLSPGWTRHRRYTMPRTSAAAARRYERPSAQDRPHPPRPLVPSPRISLQ